MKFSHLRTALLAGLFTASGLPCMAQSQGHAPSVRKSSGPVRVGSFAAYESCNFPDKLAIVERTPLNSGVSSRSVETSHGSMSVQLEAGERIVFAYPQQDFFANARLEKLPAPSYPKQKATLIEDFNHTLAQSPKGIRNYALPARKRGFEIYGLDREELSGGVLGIYLFFDDLNHVATTIHFLNQDAATRGFQTVAEYQKVRNEFLDAYTGCIRKNQGVPLTP